MKKYIIAIFACCWAIFSSCSDDDKLPNINPAATGEYTDERDGNTYGWVRIGDLEWMTSNLKYYPEAPYYECTYDLFGANYAVKVRSHLLDIDFAADYKEYGNFYTWEEARTLCPEGWRLPTDEDCLPEKPIRKVGEETKKPPFSAKERKERAWHFN